MWGSLYKRHYEIPLLLFTFREVYAQDQNLFLWLYLNVGRRRSKDEKNPECGRAETWGMETEKGGGLVKEPLHFFVPLFGKCGN